MSDTCAAMLRSAEDGEFIEVAGDELTHAIVALRRQAETNNRRAKGKITITFNLEVDPKGVLETEGEITVKLPKQKRARSLHWTSEDGEILNRRPERQLELKAVAGGSTNETKAEPVKATIKAV